MRLTILVAALCLFASVAEAHVGISSGPAAANKSQKITFSVGHGCDGHDTIAVRVEIPTGISSVRALYSDFGKPSIEGTAAAVTAVSWTKADADLQPDDFGYYELTIRARVADVPFTNILFKVRQTCKSSTGVITVVDWDQPEGATTGEPGPQLVVVPARVTGWNKYTLAAAVPFAKVPAYFGDAQIVWKGNAAYTPSAALAPLITGTPGVTALTADLAAGDEIWVKY
jgi:periplasmic copper chaperone A